MSWTYQVDAERFSLLSGAGDFTSVLDSVIRDMRVVCRHEQKCDDEAGHARAVYCIRVPPNTFDVFFNAEFGYRGAYFRSPAEGMEANRALLAALRPMLLTWAQSSSTGEFECDSDSLAEQSAKVWLAEAGAELCKHCLGDWTHPQDPTPEILNGRWELQPDYRGCKAPLGEKMRVFGAFINAQGAEFVPARKLGRASDIHVTGWT